MPHFFGETLEPNGRQIVLDGQTAHHMTRVLRMKVGEEFTVSTTDGNRHRCVVESLQPDTVCGEVLESVAGDTEPSIEITLYQALPKGDKMELIVQKAVELGVTHIVPVMTTRCVSRPDAKSMAKKCQRYRKIVEAAAKQSGRNRIPTVSELITFSELLQEVKKHQTAVVCYEGGGKRLAELVEERCADLALIVGSEGGLEEQEVQRLQESGVQPATLGKLILRCETAPLAAVSVVLHLTGNL